MTPCCGKKMTAVTKKTTKKQATKSKKTAKGKK